MTTKNKFLFSKDKQQFFITNGSKTDKSNQYSNLNLNQNYKSSTLIPVQTYSKIYNNKKYDSNYATAAIFKLPDSTKSENYDERKKSESLNKLSPNISILNKEAEKESKNHWKKKDNFLNIIKSSTLSLHIEAYENASESVASDPSWLNKKKDNTKQTLTASTFVIQNPFEFPRQQNDKIWQEPPELSQYQASQRLFNPNEATTNNGWDEFDAYGIQSRHPLYSPDVRDRNPIQEVRNFSADKNITIADRRGHGLDIALGTQSYNLVFIEVLRFQSRFFVSAFSDQTILEVKHMLTDVIEPTGPMSLYAFYPEANNFTVLKDDSTLADCGFRSSSFNQPGIIYLCFGQENPRYTADPKNKPMPQPS